MLDYCAFWGLHFIINKLKLLGQVYRKGILDSLTQTRATQPPTTTNSLTYTGLPVTPNLHLFSLPFPNI